MNRNAYKTRILKMQIFQTTILVARKRIMCVNSYYIISPYLKEKQNLTVYSLQFISTLNTFNTFM